MSNKDIIRAWKDEDYFDSLSKQERSQLPENPAGAIELLDEEMELLVGGKKKDKSNKHFTKKCVFIVSDDCDISIGVCLSFEC